MGRSKWKGPYLGSENLKSLDKKKSNMITTASRSSEIIPKFIGLTFKIHNGKSYQELLVTEEMIGHKFGEFSFTRGKFAFKKKKLKK